MTRLSWTIINNIDSFFKPIPDEATTVTTPSETPNAVSPNLPTESTKAPTRTEQPTVADISVGGVADIDYEINPGSGFNKTITLGGSNGTGNSGSTYSYIGQSYHADYATGTNVIMADGTPNDGAKQTWRHPATMYYDKTKITIAPNYGTLLANNYNILLYKDSQLLELTTNTGGRGITRSENNVDVFGNGGSVDIFYNALRKSPMFEVQKGTLRVIGPGENALFVINASFTPGSNANNGYVQAPVIKVAGGNVELKNVRIENSVYENSSSAEKNGAGIYVDSGTLHLENVYFRQMQTSNGQGGVGGVIYVKNGTVTIKNCKFGTTDNNSDNSFSAKGGVLYMENGNVTIQGGTAQNTHAVSGASATEGEGASGGFAYINGGTLNVKGMVIGGSVTVANSPITNDNGNAKYTEAHNGGAFYVKKGTLNLDNVTIQNTYASGIFHTFQYKEATTGNTVTVSSPYEKDGGGAIYVAANGTVNIKDGEIKNCVTEANGGAIHIADGGKVNMEGTRIEGCYSKMVELNGAGLPSGGGAIYAYGNIDMKSIVIKSCYAQDGDGGGMFVNGSVVNMIGCRLDNCYLSDTKNTYSYTLKSQTINLCAPVKNGAALYAQNPNEQTTAVVNLLNTAIVNSQHGAAKIARGNVYISRRAVVNLIQDNDIITSQSAAISNNEGGGGVYIYSVGTFRMYGGTMSANTYTYKNVTLPNDPNSGYSNGVAVLLHGETATNIGTFEMYGGTISNHTNQTSGKGGGVGTMGAGNIHIFGGTISGNTATNGGGIYADPGSDLYIEGGTIENNAAGTDSTGHGGGIYANAVDHFFLGNQSGDKPIIRGNHGTASATSNLLDGGGIYVVNAGIHIYDAEISGNYAKHGAGIYATFSGSPGNLAITIQKCDILNNKNGSGIWMTGSVYTLNMTGGTISGNTVTTSGHGFGGAGICVTNGVTVNISGSEATPTVISNNVNSQVSKNTATDTDTAMNGGGIACISRGNAQAAYGKTLTIKGNVTISGNSVPSGGTGSETSLNGKGLGGGIFMEEGGTVVIQSDGGYKPAIINNTAYRGGGVYVSGAAAFNTDGSVASWYASTLTVNGANFENNTSTEREYILSDGNDSNPRGLGGGAICAFHKATVSIQNSTFTGNHATMESGVGGGGISAVSLDSLTINNCDFENNYVGTSPTAISGDGGAVFMRNVDVANITGCEMKTNKAQQGGGIYYIRDDYYQISNTMAADVNITGCQIISNTDGGVFIQRNSDNTNANNRNVTVDIGTTTIQGNTLGNHGSHRFGGAGITCVNGITLNLNSGTVIDQNINPLEHITEAPAGISNIEEVDTAAHGGGVAMVKKTTATWCKVGTLTVNGGVTISGNKAEHGNGGGIYVEDGEASGAYGIVNILGTADNKVVIKDNECGGTLTTPNATKEEDKWSGSGGGGGVYLYRSVGDAGGGAVTIQHVDILRNKAHGRKADGGGLNIRGTSLIMSNCLLEENATTDTNNSSNGGGLDFELNANPLTMTDCTFIRNSTHNWGGGVNIAGTEKIVTISGCVFDNNHAGRQGGAVHVYSGPSVSISNTDFGNNFAGSFGGAILVYADTRVASVSLTNCNVGKLTDENGQLVNAGNRSGESGGGIYVAGTSGSGNKTLLTLNEGVDISNNTAGTAGGGIYFALNAVYPEFDGVVINDNTAGTNGGGVYAKNTTYSTDADKDLVFSNCSINRNTATGGSGGGIYAENIRVAVNNHGSSDRCVYSGNTAGTDGGTIKLIKGDVAPVTSGEAMFRISGTDFIDGSAGGNGGAISVETAPGYIVNCIFYDNEATGNGGAIHYVGNDVANDSVLQLAMDGIGQKVTVDGVQSNHGNKALGFGGGLYVENCKNFVNVRGGFNYNEALRGGGAYVLDCDKALFTDDADAFLYTDAGVTTNESNSYVFFGANKTYRPDNPVDPTVDGNGAGLYAESNVTLTNFIMQYNSARFDGGGLCVGKSYTVTVNGVNDINHNVSYNYGGGIIVLVGGTLNITGDAAGNNKTLIQRNRLVNSRGGAGIHVASGATFTMSYGEIIENGRLEDVNTPGLLSNAGNGYGGGIDITGGNVTVNNVIIADNAAGISGGGVRLAGGSFTANNCFITGNVSGAGNGGGVYVMGEGSTATVNGYVVGNTAKGTASGTSMVAAGSVQGVGGGVAVFDGASFTLSGGAIYDNNADVGGADVFSNGLGGTKLSILRPEAMDTNGATLGNVSVDAFNRNGETAGKWWEDYMKGDTNYTEGLYGDIPPAMRYADSPVSIRAYTSSTEGTQSKGNYINTDGEFVSIIFDIQKYNVGTITITAPKGSDENQRFVFEITGVTDKGESVSFTVSLESEETAVIENLYPGTYMVTQKTNWSWRYEIDGVVVDDGNKQPTDRVQVTIEGTSVAERHDIDYSNTRGVQKWLSHNSEGVVNYAVIAALGAFDVAEAKKTIL